MPPLPCFLFLILLFADNSRASLSQLIYDSAATNRLSDNKQIQKKKKKKSQTMQLASSPSGNGCFPYANSAHLLANVHRHQFPSVSEEDPVSVRGGERKAPEARGHRVQRLLPALLPSHLPPELTQEG